MDDASHRPSNGKHDLPGGGRFKPSLLTRFSGAPACPSVGNRRTGFFFSSHIANSIEEQLMLVLQRQRSADCSTSIFLLFSQFVGDPLLEIADLADVPQTVGHSPCFNVVDRRKFSIRLAGVRLDRRIRGAIVDDGRRARAAFVARACIA